METWLLGVRVSFVVAKSRCSVSVLVSRLSKNKFQFWLKFHPRKLFYFEYICKCSTCWPFCFIAMRWPSDGSNCFRNNRLGFNSESGKTKLSASLLDAQQQRNCAVNDGDDNF